MKTVYIKEFGGTENLEIRDVPGPPKPRGSDVIVRVRAAGVNRADLLQRMGLYPGPEGFDPHRPGLEFAGEVADVGEGVVGWRTGDRVMAITAGEAQAEFVSADASLLIRIPDNLSFAKAAAIPEAFITAHDAIWAQGGLKDGETLLVHAVGSGVGLAALQMAKAKNASVIGTSRTQEKLDAAAEFGLDHAIVVTGTPAFSGQVAEMTGGRGADVILDLVGGSYFHENLKSLASRGRLLLVGLTGGASAEIDLRLALQKRATIIGTILRSRSLAEKAEATRSFAEQMMEHFVDGTIEPVIDKVFPASETAAAHEYLASNESFGKVVLEF